MILPRYILPALENEMTMAENLVITGMRQVGKTTMLKHLFSQIDSPNKILLDLENPLYRKLFEEEHFDKIWQNLAEFGILKEKKAYIFLDEVQNLPSISQVVKYLSDHWEVKFVLTGSSSYYLKNMFPESMSGRKVVYEVFPLTFDEFLGFKGISRQEITSFTDKAENKNIIAYEKYSGYYKEYVTYGGFPKVVLQQDPERKRIILNEVFTSYFEHDVKLLANFKEFGRIRDLILLLAPCIGQKIDVSKLGVILGTSRETVYSYLTFLEKTYFIKLLPKYSNSIDRQVAGGKKLFLCDSGIATILGSVSEGQLLEQSVFQTLHPQHDLAFFITKSGGEIDFVVDKETALEVKTNVSKQEIEFFKRKMYKQSFKHGYLVSSGFSSEPEVIVTMSL